MGRASSTQFLYRTVALVFLLSAGLSWYRHPHIDAGWAGNVAIAAAFWSLSLWNRRAVSALAQRISLVAAAGFFAAAAVFFYARVQAE